MSSVSEMRGWRIVATDGEVGQLRDIFFDDERWVARYIVVHTGSWLLGRHVLLSPVFARGFSSRDRLIQFNLTRKQIRGAPGVDVDKPVSRQMEVAYGKYYDYPPYWAYGHGGSVWGWGPFPTSAIDPRVHEEMIAREMREREARSTEEADEHLRSASGVIGYSVEARDGSIGHVEDLLLDDESWAVRYVVVDTRNWLPGKHVVVSPQRFSSVEWAERAVWVDMTREQIKASPEFVTQMAHDPRNVRLTADQRSGSAGVPPGT